jgi:thiol-disulfide isomerase/thioredoxin
MKFSKIVVAMLLAAMATSAPAAQVKVGKPVPDVLLVLADGTKVHLSDLRGQIVVLNLWATWCVLLREPAPAQ